MALRFQHEDDVDRELERSRTTLGCVFLLALGIAACFLVSDAVYLLIFGGGLAKYGKDALETVAGCVFVALAIRLIEPKYEEFRIRTKEIDGKVSAIEEAVRAMRNAQADLFDKMVSVEGKIESQQSSDETVRTSARVSGHLPADVATEEDISRAVVRALQETQAKSIADMGLVIKTARGHLKGKSFKESELQAYVQGVDLFQRKT